MNIQNVEAVSVSPALSLVLASLTNVEKIMSDVIQSKSSAHVANIYYIASPISACSGFGLIKKVDSTQNTMLCERRSSKGEKNIQYSTETLCRKARKLDYEAR